MNILFCDKCLSGRKTIRFDKDNPILECGHIKTVYDVEKEIIIDNFCENICRELMNAYNISRDTAMKFNLNLI